MYYPASQGSEPTPSPGLEQPGGHKGLSPSPTRSGPAPDPSGELTLTEQTFGARADRSSHTIKNGYTSHFERRPQQLFDTLVEVVDASTSVRERLVGSLKAIEISKVFAGDREVFLGFGRPNTYLTFPGPNGEYLKFDAKSLRRRPSVIRDTRGIVQSGFLLRMLDLPDRAIERLREVAPQFDGKKYWTCVNANCRLLEAAGFTSGRTPLSRRYSSSGLLRSMLRDGLSFEGSPIATEVVKTTSTYLQSYWGGIIKDECLTLLRHSQRALEPLLSRFSFLHPLYAWLEKKAESWTAAAIAPPLPEGSNYKRDLELSVSQPSTVGSWLRTIWGPHSIFELRQPRVDVDRYLPQTLVEFSHDNPSLLTRFKQRVLFSRPVVGAIRSNLCPHFVPFGTRSEVDIYDLLNTDSRSDSNRYNLVITGNRVIVSKLNIHWKAVDWLLSKHVLVSGYDRDVRFASEVWKDEAGVIRVNRNSGTYRPTAEQWDGAVEFLRDVFPNLKVEKDPGTGPRG